MAFLPGNRQIFTLLGKVLGAGLAVGQGVWGAMEVSKAESQPAPGEEMPNEESTGTLARLDSVSTLVRSFPLEHFCYFKLSAQQGRRKKKRKSLSTCKWFCKAHQCCSARWGIRDNNTNLEGNSSVRFASAPPVAKGCIKLGSAGSWMFHWAAQLPGKLSTLFALLLTSDSSLSPPHFFFRTLLYEYPWLNLHCIRVKHFKFLHSRSKSDRLYEAIIPAGILYF